MKDQFTINRGSLWRIGVVGLLGLVVLAVSFWWVDGETEYGSVVQFGQTFPTGGGQVQSFITVVISDGTEVKAWLPMEQEIWDTFSAGVRSNARMVVELRRGGQDEPWKFHRVLTKP